ncbi:hypothetical protein [Psittacicella hinzii]|uniref:Uncharacterized protein n=1 Tax=Psittacicella hinzii TaxID=2028575 RepID=A0A3A1YGN2_9GAMM|nr:hypothetical protein [Psittacicella hinzii]RIY36751.1 hypothetical protein CKF58_05745 [Psittacicella hinzii]
MRLLSSCRRQQAQQLVNNQALSKQQTTNKQLLNHKCINQVISSNCKRVSIGLLALSLTACSSLDIGHNKFYCQEAGSKCVNASTYLSNNPKNPQVTPIANYADITLKQVIAPPQMLLNMSSNDDAYLKIWFAPNMIGNKVYPSRYLLIPYIR